MGTRAAHASGGCRQDKGGETAEKRHKQDIEAQAEGRLQVDQSAVLPVGVRAGVQREYPGATVQKVTKKTYQGAGGAPGVRYEVELTTKDGKHVTREFDDRGKGVSGGM